MAGNLISAEAKIALPYATRMTNRVLSVNSLPQLANVLSLKFEVEEISRRPLNPRYEMQIPLCMS